MYVQEKIIGIGFGSICGFRPPLGFLEHNPHRWVGTTVYNPIPVTLFLIFFAVYNVNKLINIICVFYRQNNPPTFPKETVQHILYHIQCLQKAMTY